MKFLMEAITQRRRMWRIDDWLLMMIRTLAIGLFVLALARPLLKSGWFGSSGPRDVILILDTSMSTSQHFGKGPLFDELKQLADDMIDRLNNDDIMRIILASTAPEWLAPVGISINADSKRELHARIRQLEPTLAGTDLIRCIQEGVLAEPANERATRVITVLTDDQSYSWRTRTPGTWQGLKEKLNQLPNGMVINIVTVGDQNRAVTNLSVESLTASRTIMSPGEIITLTASVKNVGHIASKATLISWYQGDNQVGVTTLPTLPPKQTTSANIEHIFDTPGVYEMTCHINGDDDLMMDNDGRLAVEVVERAPILVVDGSGRADPIETETGYLLAALGHGSDFTERYFKSVFHPTVIAPADLNSLNLSDYCCVILANISRLPNDITARLIDYVRHGGGLWVVLGDQTDRQFFNQRFFAQGAGLAVLPLDEPLGDPDDRQNYVRLHPPTTHHIATKLLADTQKLDIDRVRLYRRHRFQAADDNKGASILLTAGHDVPVAVEQVFNKGRVIVQTIPMSLKWSNLPLSQAFVVMVHEWLWYLAEPNMNRWNINTGEALSVSFPKNTVNDLAEVITSGGLSAKAAFEVRDNLAIYRYTDTLHPGRYQLKISNENETVRTLPFCVRRDPDESGLNAVTDEEKNAITKAMGSQFVTDPLADASDGEGFTKAEPIWSWLLIILLMLLLFESILAGGITRRRLIQSKPVIMEPGQAGL
jgi:hypothetical protein